MPRLILHFLDFINEGYYNRLKSATLLYDLYKEELFQIPPEEEILEKVKEIENKWHELTTNSKYSFNRESRLGKDHFAINAKIYNFPDNDEVRNRLKIQELTDDDVSLMWQHYIYEQAEIFTDSINYSWVNNVSWAGKSGGWLVLVLEYSTTDVFESVESELMQYLSFKEGSITNGYKKQIQDLYADQNFLDLLELRVVQMPEWFDEWKGRIDRLVSTLDKELEEAKSIEIGLDEIIAQIDRFKQNGVTWFYEMLDEEPDYALDSIHH